MVPRRQVADHHCPLFVDSIAVVVAQAHDLVHIANVEVVLVELQTVGEPQIRGYDQGGIGDAVAVAVWQRHDLGEHLVSGWWRTGVVPGGPFTALYLHIGHVQNALGAPGHEAGPHQLGEGKNTGCKARRQLQHFALWHLALEFIWHEQRYWPQFQIYLRRQEDLAGRGIFQLGRSLGIGDGNRQD